MAGYSIRSLADLSKTARGYFTRSIEGAVASVWANTFTVTAKVMALLDFEHEMRRKWLVRQMFASTADDLWLARHGYELGLARAGGTAAIGQVSVTAPIGTFVPSGLTFLRSDGATYTTLTGATSLTGTVALFCEADAVGEAGNLGAGETLALSSEAAAPDGLGAVATVLAAEDGAGLSGGSDPEALESFRARVLTRKRAAPHGGANQDYRTWVAEALTSVRGVWVDSFTNDSRSIWVMFTVTDQPNGIPTLAQVAQAQAYIDDDLRRPVTARAFVSRPSPSVVPILIAGLSPDTPDIRDAIAAEVAAEFVDRAEPGKPTRGDFVLSRSWIVEAIGRATGEDRHRLVSPAGDLVFPAGSYPVAGPISYTD